MISGPWPGGLNNKLSDHDLPKSREGSHAFFRNGVNIDLDAAGYPRRRSGYERVLSGSFMHSAWSSGEHVFLVKEGRLMSVNADLTLTTLYEGVVGNRVSYDQVGDDVYITDGVIGLVVRDGVASLWGQGVEALDDGTLTKLPPGDIIRHYRGRNYVVRGNEIHYSEPFIYDAYRASTNWFVLPSEITIFEPVASGIWVVADKTYFYDGAGPESFKPTVMSKATGTFGTSARSDKGLGNAAVTDAPETKGVVWYGSNGTTLGTDDGRLLEIQQANVATHLADEGVGFIREVDGVRSYLASLKNPQAPALAASSWMEAEVVRKGASNG